MTTGFDGSRNVFGVIITMVPRDSLSNHSFDYLFSELGTVRAYTGDHA
jgi:hypothetical protein